jgi:PAS domain S-box-containing protein
MEPKQAIQRYRQLQHCVQWSDADAERMAVVGQILAPHLPALIDSFLTVLRNQPAAQRVITGGESQWASLRHSLTDWLNQLFAGVYDAAYVERRARVGRRHRAIDLDQAYTNAALACLRSSMTEALQAHWTGTPRGLLEAIGSLNRLLDLDLAIIQDAYESEHTHRQSVAARTRIRNVLHQEKEFIEGLWEHAQAIILVLDVHGCVIRYNLYLEDLTGVPYRNVKGVDWFETFVPQTERERQRAVFQEALQHSTSAADSTLRTRSGHERRISWSNTSLKNVAGRTVAMLAIGQDITELNQAQQRALQAERLAAIGQMITGLAHETRNALQRIQACAEMLEIEVEGNTDALDLVHRIKLAQDHMHRLFDEVRGYAAPIKLDRSTCHLGSVWREAWELLLPQWEGRIAEMIERTEGVDLGLVGDHFRLVQLLRILLENSLAACSDPVRIEIACHPILLGTTHGLHVSVRDNGPGLNQQQREHLFEPFYTTKTKGTGLGLAIAQRIVEAHGGQISVGDDTRGGAEIVVCLPRAAPE